MWIVGLQKCYVSKLFTLRRFDPDHITIALSSPNCSQLLRKSVTLPLDKRFRAISDKAKVFRLAGPDRFKNRFNKERSTFSSGAEQSCSITKVVPELAFAA